MRITQPIVNTKSDPCETTDAQLSKTVTHDKCTNQHLAEDVIDIDTKHVDVCNNISHVSTMRKKQKSDTYETFNAYLSTSSVCNYNYQHNYYAELCMLQYMIDMDCTPSELEIEALDTIESLDDMLRYNQGKNEGDSMDTAVMGIAGIPSRHEKTNKNEAMIVIHQEKVYQLNVLGCELILVPGAEIITGRMSIMNGTRHHAVDSMAEIREMLEAAFVVPEAVLDKMSDEDRDVAKLKEIYMIERCISMAWKQLELGLNTEDQCKFMTKHSRVCMPMLDPHTKSTIMVKNKWMTRNISTDSLLETALQGKMPAYDGTNLSVVAMESKDITPGKRARDSKQVTETLLQLTANVTSV